MGDGDRGGLQEAMQFPLMEAIFGRRSRRFGRGMEMPQGPLSYRSRRDSLSLSEREEAVLIAAATGVSGWHFGVPYSPGRPGGHAEFSQRFTGRTTPTAAGFGTPVLFYTNDRGCFVVNTRDVTPERMREVTEGMDDLERAMALCRECTVKLSDERLDLPARPPHMLPPNLWMANAPGSTLWMPVGDCSEQFLGLLTLALAHGALVVDRDTGEPAGELEPFLSSGLLDEAKVLPLQEVQADAYETNCLELAMIGHNIVLVMQAMGLGGLYLAGLNRWSVLGASAGDGIRGLGFECVEDRQGIKNPVGLAGIYEGLCPPFVADMDEAVEIFVERKFGEEGAYAIDDQGPWRRGRQIKESVTVASEEFVDCLKAVARYVHGKYGVFPGTRTTMVLPGFVQTVHLDCEYYDEHYEPGAYLPTHAHHDELWHGDEE